MNKKLQKTLSAVGLALALEACDPYRVMPKSSKIGDLEVKATEHGGGRQLSISLINKDKNSCYLSATDTKSKGQYDGAFDAIHLTTNSKECTDKLNPYINEDKLNEVYKQTISQ